jgi:hypothetical protein
MLSHMQLTRWSPLGVQNSNKIHGLKTFETYVKAIETTQSKNMQSRPINPSKNSYLLSKLLFIILVVLVTPRGLRNAHLDIAFVLRWGRL